MQVVLGTFAVWYP